MYTHKNKQNVQIIIKVIVSISLISLKFRNVLGQRDDVQTTKYDKMLTH